MRRAAVLVCVVVVLTVMSTPAVAAATSGTAPDRAVTATPIKHFVYLMQEGHSFDEYFGTYPGADAIPPGVCEPLDARDPGQGCLEPADRGDHPPLAIPHGPDVERAQIDGGRMDGFASVFGDSAAARSAMSHYDQRQLPWYWNLAHRYVLFDRFFSSTVGSPVADRLYWMSGTGGSPALAQRPARASLGDDIPTVFDRLEAAGISWKVYVQGYTELGGAAAVDGTTPAATSLAERVPLLEMPRFRNDPALTSRIVDLSEYYQDLQQGTLPSVAYVVSSGASSELPPADPNAGQTFVRGLVNELMRSSAWDSSAFLVSFDDSGGAYDHVAPPTASADGVPFGPRVPALLVSPYARSGQIDHTLLDATSGLAFIRQNWGIDPLAAHDRAASSFANALDPSSAPRPPTFVPAVDVVATKPTSTRSLYPLYGLALLIPLAIAGATAWRSRRGRPS